MYAHVSPVRVRRDTEPVARVASGDSDMIMGWYELRSFLVVYATFFDKLFIMSVGVAPTLIEVVHIQNNLKMKIGNSR